MSDGILSREGSMSGDGKTARGSGSEGNLVCAMVEMVRKSYPNQEQEGPVEMNLKELQCL